jgi:hypothetical protein
MDVDEKPNVYHIEGVRDEDVGELQLEIEKITLLNEEDFKAEERALLKKVRPPFFFFSFSLCLFPAHRYLPSRQIDFTLMPTLFVLLILNYLDRNALASARVQGIEADLGMTGNQFNTSISLLFVGYIIGQLPSNIILNRSRPSIYLSCCVFVWVRFLPLFFSFLRSQTNSSLQGMVSLSTGFVKNYHQLLAVRILLGFTGSLSPFSSHRCNADLSVASTRIALLPRRAIYPQFVVY